LKNLLWTAKNLLWTAFAIEAALASTAFAQNSQRQAQIVGGGGRDSGRCTVEVVVDDVAQVELRGSSATLHTISGQPAQWRRFECTAAMPPNPVNLQFRGIDGRGRQALVRDARNGGPAVVEIEDKDGGAEGYTFEITWGANGGPVSGYPAPGGPPRDYPQDRGNPQDRAYPQQDRAYPQDEYRPNYREGDYYRRYHHGFTSDEAIRVCQQAVTTEASRRFRTNDVHMHRTRIDDQPGRQDWVLGTLDVHRGNHEELYGFSCSVDFQTGQVRSANLDDRPLPDDSRWR
jgi:hypothetical protein